MRRLALVVSVLVACRTAPPVREPQEEKQIPLGRFQQPVVPTSERVELRVDPASERFSGRVSIALKITAPVTEFFVHGRGLHVTEAEVVAADRTIAAAWRQVHEDGVARLSLESQLNPGAAELRIAFDAPFDPGLVGLYRVREGDAWYAFTQFEPIAARKAFPCFDEPSAKIPWNVSLTIPDGQVAISNTAESEQIRNADGTRTIRFAQTPPMPSYLVAFAAGPLEIVDAAPIAPNAVRSAPLPLRGVAVKGKGARLKHALEKAGGLVQVLEDYFGIAYPYGKLDLVAVPDFAAGAMENAGLVTFKEWLLLLGDDAPADQRRAFAEVTAHELAHQWFGNLVTMQWWDDLWLNEAFATWMATRVIRTWDPAANADLGALADTHEVMELDSRAAARAVRQPIATSHDIHNAFDGITYEKGAAVLRMFETWIGEERWQEGVRNYLVAHRFGNATADDFFAAISAVAKQDVAAAMRTFVDQPGVPLVTWTPDETAGVVHLATERYLPLGSQASRDGQWRVPLVLKLQRVGTTEHVLLEGTRDVRTPMARIANEGYFRLAPAMSVEKLPARTPEALVANRLGSSNAGPQLEAGLSQRADQLAALRAGRMPYDVVAPLLVLEADPTKRFGVAEVAELLGFTRDRLLATDVERGVLEAFLQRYFAREFRDLVFTLDAPYRDLAVRREQLDDEALLVRRDLLSFAVHVARDPRLRAEAATLGTAWAKGETHPAIVPTFLGLVLGVAVEEGGQPVFDALVAKLQASDDSNVRRRILGALGRASGPLGERARALILEPMVHSDEIWSLLGSHLSRVENAEATWAWVKANDAALRTKLPEEYQGYMPNYGATQCSEAAAADVERFFAPNIESLPGGPRQLADAIEEIRICAAQVAAHRDAARRYFTPAK